MKILSIDLGLMTGMVYYDSEQNELIYSRTYALHDVIPNIEATDPEHVVLEKMPEGMSSELAQHYQSIQDLCANKITLIYPGLWKPVASGRKWAAKGSTRHEKDAYLMLHYFMVYQDHKFSHEELEF